MHYEFYSPMFPEGTFKVSYIFLLSLSTCHWVELIILSLVCQIKRYIDDFTSAFSQISFFFHIAELLQPNLALLSASISEICFG